jgi:biotin-(acetyl-CoA carboxylase) ligase
MKIEGRSGYKVKDVLTSLLSKLKRKILQFNRGTGLFPAEEWRKKDFLAGKTINVQSGDNFITGRYLGVDETGRLKLADESGSEHFFWTGDVSVKAGD